jgi:beta-galactosidase
MYPTLEYMKRYLEDETTDFLPRLGFELIMREGFEQMEYFGFGPFETTVDKHEAARLARYKTTVTDNFEHYIYPYNNGCHYGTRFAAVTNETGQGLYFTGSEPFVFTALHNTAEQITKAKHDFELEPINQPRRRAAKLDPQFER